MSTASRRGQDKRGRDRSAAIPPNIFLPENMGKIWQHMATCGNTCALKTICYNMWENVVLL